MHYTCNWVYRDRRRDRSRDRSRDRYRRRSRSRSNSRDREDINGMTRSLTGIAWNKEKYQGTPLQLDDDRLGTENKTMLGKVKK